MFEETEVIKIFYFLHFARNVYHKFFFYLTNIYTYSVVITRVIYTKIISTKNKIVYEMHKTVNWYLRRNASFFKYFLSLLFLSASKKIFFVKKKLHRIMHKMFQDFILAQEPGKAEHLLAFIKKKCVCLNVFSPSESFLKTQHSRELQRSFRS